MLAKLEGGPQHKLVAHASPGTPGILLTTPRKRENSDAPTETLYWNSERSWYERRAS